MKLNLTFCLLFFLTSAIFAQNNIAIIPQPAEMQQNAGVFKLKNGISIGFSSSAAKSNAAVLTQKLQTATGYTLPQSAKGIIQLALNGNKNLGEEGYTLEVTPKNINIAANTEKGLYYGVQTLFQLMPKEIESSTVIKKTTWDIPCVKITDYPRFKWRGLMLDVSRHFFTKEDVKKYIDLMSRYKYNVLHWHLTDDNGWRVEIKSYPKLTQVGACRVPRNGKFGNLPAPKEGEAATDCGFYTQADIKEIIAYAAERHVSILPEIDVPGHSMAAVAAYPELCCTKNPKVYVSPGHNFAEWYGNGQFKMLEDNTLNPSDENVYTFLDKVLGEIAQLFPHPYIHIGGDECYHGYWEADANCQAFMKKENMKNTHELQSYFMKRMEKIISAKGKRMIGWDEILEGGLAPSAAVMSWRGLEGGIEAAKLGHEVVMTPNDYVYIDLLQGEPTVEPDATAYKVVKLKKTYEFEPVPEGIDAKYILGGEANLWSEKVPTYRHALYMTYPRAWATADIYWSPKSAKNWDKFVSRVENHFERFDVAELPYAPSVFDAVVKTKMDNGKLIADLSCEANGMDIYYTINETIPDKFATKYTQPIEIPEGDLTLKVVTYKNGKQKGRVVPISRADLLKRVKK